MIIGYFLAIDDNDSFMLDEDSTISRCPVCGYKTDLDFCENTFKIKKKKYDLSYTYDGICIASEKFRAFCLKEELEGLNFQKIEGSPGFYCFSSKNLLEVDLSSSNIEFDSLCSSCGNYESTTGGPPSLFLKNVTSPLHDGIYRTDLLFASGDEKFPFLLVGIDTYEKMRSMDFSGIDYEILELK